MNCERGILKTRVCIRLISLVGIAETEFVEPKRRPTSRVVKHSRRRFFSIPSLKWMSGTTVKLLQLMPTKSCRRLDCGEKLVPFGERLPDDNSSVGESRFNSINEKSHFNCTEGCFVALIVLPWTGPIERLLVGVDGEDAKHNRHAGS